MMNDSPSIRSRIPIIAVGIIIGALGITFWREIQNSWAGFERSEVVTLTPLAAQKVIDVSDGRDLTETAYLRVGVVPDGGPHFFHYHLAITETVDPKTDLIGNSHGIQIVVDRISSPYLIGTSIDWVTDNDRSGFMFDNPNARTPPPDDARSSILPAVGGEDSR